MEKVAPAGGVYQAGTLSGNPLAMAAGIAMLREIGRRSPFAQLEEKSARLEASIRDAVRASGGEARVRYQRVGSMSTLFFTGESVEDFSSAKGSETRRYATFFHAMLERGVSLPPAQFEAWFLSTAHTDADLARVARVVRESLTLALEKP